MSKFLTYPQPVLARQHHIQDHEVKRFAHGALKPGRPVLGGTDFVAFFTLFCRPRGSTRRPSLSRQSLESFMPGSLDFLIALEA